MKDKFHFLYKPQRCNRSVYFGTEAISSLAPKIWELLPNPIKSYIAGTV